MIDKKLKSIILKLIEYLEEQEERDYQQSSSSQKKKHIYKDVLFVKEALKESQPDYEKAYDILMEYWDSMPDEEKEDIDKRLKRCGL